MHFSMVSHRHHLKTGTPLLGAAETSLCMIPYGRCIVLISSIAAGCGPCSAW